MSREHWSNNDFPEPVSIKSDVLNSISSDIGNMSKIRDDNKRIIQEIEYVNNKLSDLIISMEQLHEDIIGIKKSAGTFISAISFIAIIWIFGKLIHAW